MERPSFLTSACTTASDTIWTIWVQESTGYTSSTGTTGASGNLLDCETTSLTGTASATSNKIWTIWHKKLWDETPSITSGNGVTTGIGVDPWPIWVNQSNARTLRIERHVQRFEPQISDEEFQRRRQEEQRLREERQQRAAAEAKEREAATVRAQLILREHLTDEQKAELADKRYFTLTKIDSVTGERRHYRIHQGRSGNVEQVDENGKKVRRFCIHPRINCPDEDTMLTQMLWLRTQEDEFRRVANQS